MKYLEELFRISDLEDYSFNKDIDHTFHDTNIFDEVPLISRINHCSNLKKTYSATQLNADLLNTAIFYANHLKLRAFHTMPLEEHQKYLICITYPDFDNNECFGNVYIPNLCITQQRFLSEMSFSSLEYEQAPWLFDALKLLNLQSKVVSKYTISKDEYGRYTRLYIFL